MKNTKPLKIFLKLITLTALTMTIFSCSSSKKIEKYANNTPKFDILKYFSGKSEAYGILQDRSGEVTRRFTVKMTGKVSGNQLVLQEYFIFDDGEKQERIWTVTVKDENNFTAQAGDVIGTAIGKQYGNAMKMKYVLSIPYKGKNMNVSVDDWMYLIDEKSLVNVSEIKKFGFVVAKLTIGFKKLD